jgi:hypothetical protein
MQNFTIQSNEADGNQWYRNDTIIPGATDYTLFAGADSLRNRANKYYTIIHNNCGSYKSNEIVITEYILGTTEAQESTGLNSVSISPNPADNSFSILVAAEELNSISLVEIYDTYGTPLSKIQGEDLQNEIRVREMSSGMYMLKITCKGEIIWKKLVVQH